MGFGAMDFDEKEIGYITLETSEYASEFVCDNIRHSWTQFYFDYFL